MEELENLKFKESILAASYWENFKFEKELVQMYGGFSDGHPKVLMMIAETEKIQKEWHQVKNQIIELKNKTT